MVVLINVNQTPSHLTTYHKTIQGVKKGRVWVLPSTELCKTILFFRKGNNMYTQHETDFKATSVYPGVHGRDVPTIDTHDRNIFTKGTQGRGCEKLNSFGQSPLPRGVTCRIGGGFLHLFCLLLRSRICSVSHKAI